MGTNDEPIIGEGMLNSHTFYEFFAGGGMVRAGLGPNWNCLFANDIDRKKAATYEANWGKADLHLGDVAKVSTNQLPGMADLAWASFPCQDLSLAGDCRGLKGERSGTFWPFWRLMETLKADQRAPKIIVLENVYGAITSNGGRDFASIAGAFANLGYSYGAAVMDAKLWVPQSRPRLFFIGIHPSLSVPSYLIGEPSLWHPKTLRSAVTKIPKNILNNWIWWNIREPEERNNIFADIVEVCPEGCDWHTVEATQQLIDMMSPYNLKKLNEAVVETYANQSRIVGGVYKRTRDGRQRAEVRFDNIAGCLRTPTGGSSRQTVIFVENGNIRSRLLSPREAARLMGLSDGYKLPERYNDAYHVCGDGVAVPVVRHIAQEILEPILSQIRVTAAAE